MKYQVSAKVYNLFGPGSREWVITVMNTQQECLKWAEQINGKEYIVKAITDKQATEWHNRFSIGTEDDLHIE